MSQTPSNFLRLIAAFVTGSVILLLFPVQLPAGDSPKTVQAKRTTQAPHIDGFLNEEVWNLASPISDFTQRDPQEGALASERTTIRVLYDNDAIYFGCMMEDSEPDKIVHRLARRDDEVESDYISIRIDSFHDHQTGFEFTINASGTKVDILQYNDANEENESWDVVWDVSTQLLNNGWSAEVRIPFRALRFSDAREQTWGINFIRTISRKKEKDYWILVRKNESGFISRFGHLVGIEITEPPRRLELLPYVVGNAEYQQKSFSHPTGRDYTGNTGFDLKYGMTSNLTLDLTVNPDFGQVEADPSVLNLTTFETFYPEKRPFFIEGSQILRFTTFLSQNAELGPGLFYSRRIGRATTKEATPPSGGSVLDEPKSASILGAAKITGKTSSGVSIGILEAMTDEENAAVTDLHGQRMKQVLEPFGNYSLFRLRKDVLENSNVGMVLTSVAHRSSLPAYTGGVDWSLKFEQNRYGADGFLAFSRAVAFDLSRSTGAAGRLTLRKEGGEHWLGSFDFDFTSKHFYINDIGFFRRPNDIGSSGDLRYKEDKPGKVVRQWYISPSYHVRWNFDGAMIFKELFLNSYFEFTNYWSVGGGVVYDFRVHDDRESRGHGLYRQPARRTWRLEVETDNRKPIIGELEEGYTYDLKGQRSWSTSLTTTIRPNSWLDFQTRLVYNRTRNREGWVLNDLTPSGTEVSIFGTRHVDEFSLTVRGSVTLRTDLTLQLYSQLFVAKAHYYGLRQLIAPDQFIPYAYSGNPDFNRKAFNLNLVLRWEYLPGSTLFLVWSQARSLDGPGGYFSSLGTNLVDVYKIPVDNVFLLKISYWWSL